MQITYCDMCGKETHWDVPCKFSARFDRPNERDSFSAELCSECTKKVIQFIKMYKLTATTNTIEVKNDGKG